MLYMMDLEELNKFYEIVIFVNSVPGGYKLDGNWLRRFQINQSVISLHSRLVLRNIVWEKCDLDHSGWN
jgi:hypothetical protein